MTNSQSTNTSVPSKEVQPLTPEATSRSRRDSNQSTATTSATNGLVSAFATLSSLTSSFSSSSSTLKDDVSITSTPDFIKMRTERANLIGLTHLIVKDLISSSILTNRTIESEGMGVHLHNFFTLIEKVLHHGLKARILSARAAGLWNLLESLPHHMRETTLISESIKSLPNAKSTDGRIRAWMRLAMMQKKLPEYFCQLLQQKNELKEIYNDSAFMLNEEAPVFAGLIIGVNVIDCNFFVKDDNFDETSSVIDLTPYLKVANVGFGPDEPEIVAHSVSSADITAVLDQKNYLEELNSHLQTVVSDLRNKLKRSEDKNRHLEMELSLSETKIKLQSGSGQYKISDQNYKLDSSNISTATTPIATSTPQPSIDDMFENISIEQAGLDLENNGAKEGDETSIRRPSLQDASYQTDDSDLEKAAALKESADKIEINRLRERMTVLEESLRESLKKINVLSSQLDIKSSTINEKDTTISLLRKENKDKQDQIDSVRGQLIDIKQLNKGLFERLEQADTGLKERIQTVTRLQTNLDKWKLENRELSNRYLDLERERNSLSKEVEALKANNAELSQSNGSIVENLKNEREQSKKSAAEVERQSRQFSDLKAKCHSLREELFELREYKRKHDELVQKLKEYELSLEQVGAQLRESQLEIESLKESSDFLLQAQWMDSKSVKECAQCQQVFSLTNRKHHCRNCGRVLCTKCSDQVIDMPSSSKPVRVCDHCYAILILKKCQSQ